MRLRTVRMDFYYQDTFKAEPPEAYETLLLRRDDGGLDPVHARRPGAGRLATTFARSGNLGERASADFPNYAAGSWGPEAAEALIARDGRSWFSVQPSAQQQGLLR